MKWSKLFLHTSKDAPADAEIPSHKLMMRAGMLKKVGPGIYTYQYLALKAIRKFEAIVRNELDKLGCQEILMPMVHPKALWDETGRWELMGDQLLKFQNRNEQWYCLAGTHEEAVTDLVRSELQSYKQLPHIIYQIQTKYRDEIRPRFGLMRGREFIMKDAYSFDLDVEGALKSYDKMYQAYQNIFKSLGVDFRIVEADAGNIGGSKTHEFQVLAEAGEDHLMVCQSCSYASNIEITPSQNVQDHYDGKFADGTRQKFATKGLKTIADLSKRLKTEQKFLVKTLFYKNDKNIFCLLTRGSDEANEVKIKKELKLSGDLLFLEPSEVQVLTGALPGSCGPIGLNIPVYADQNIKNYKNFVVGANEDDVHFNNVNFSDFKVTQFLDLTKAQDGQSCPQCKTGELKSYRGIEVGHCFYLGNKYSKSMNAAYLDAEGKTCLTEMGCYGIGVTRAVQASIEQNHDADGIIWPKSISPFHVHICALDPQNAEVMKVAEELYQLIAKAGFDVFMDDREERPGVKFKDADLLGFPVRLVIGAKSLAEGKVEIKVRKTKEAHNCSPQQVLEILSPLLK